MANSVEDYLIDGLSFKLNPGASYVADRRSVSYFPSGSNIYQAGSGARVIRMNLTGEGWLDPSTVRVTYTLVNNESTATKILRPISGPWSFFRRARCLVGGAIVDDIDYYNRVHEMLHILTSKANRDNDTIEGFGARWDDDASYNNWTTEYGAIVKGGSARAVSFKPLFGLLNQSKYIPLMWSPLMFEFEVVNGATDAIAGVASSDLTSTNTSTIWQIQDIRIVCDLVTLDSALQNSYAEHVLSGKPLPINYGSYVTQFQSIASADFAVSVTRAVSRLKSVFINFDGNHSPDSSSGIKGVFHRTFNTFAGPMYGTDYVGGEYNYERELQWQLQIGSKLFPEYPCRSMAETFYQLKKALGIHGSAFHSIAITDEQYRNDHFIIGVDTEKILEAGFTGLNTKAGDLMVVRGKGANANYSAAWATSIYIILHTDQILEIRDSGCQVFD